MNARTAASNQLHSLCDTAPETVRAQLRPLTFHQKIATAERWRPRSGHDLEATSRRALRSIARRWRALVDRERHEDSDRGVALHSMSGTGSAGWPITWRWA